jgi:hypothetical protein
MFTQKLELNESADKLSKEALLLQEGKLVIVETEIRISLRRQLIHFLKDM